MCFSCACARVLAVWLLGVVWHFSLFCQPFFQPPPQLSWNTCGRQSRAAARAHGRITREGAAAGAGVRRRRLARDHHHHHAGAGTAAAAGQRQKGSRETHHQQRSCRAGGARIWNARRLRTSDFVCRHMLAAHSSITSCGPNHHHHASATPPPAVPLNAGSACARAAPSSQRRPHHHTPARTVTSRLRRAPPQRFFSTRACAPAPSAPGPSRASSGPPCDQPKTRVPPQKCDRAGRSSPRKHRHNSTGNNSTSAAAPRGPTQTAKCAREVRLPKALRHEPRRGEPPVEVLLPELRVRLAGRHEVVLDHLADTGGQGG